MKKRIVALILTVVMSLLALTSCGSYDFAKESYDGYAKFNSDKFNAGLQNIVIRDGKFTTNDETRALVLADAIYSAIADKIITEAGDEDKLTSGAITEGDILYFVYYAEDAEGNIYFTSNMDEGTLSSTDTSVKNKHYVKLDGYYGYEDDDNKNKIDEPFMALVAQSVLAKIEGVDLKDYAYSMLTKTEIEAKAEEELKASKPEATEDDIDAAKTAALKVAEGDTIIISYTRTWSESVDGNNVDHTKKAAYEEITLNDLTDPFQAFFKEASVGSNVLIPADATIAGTVEGKEVQFKYSDVKVVRKLEKHVEALASFKYTPYTKEAKFAPDSLYSVTGSTTNTVDLNGKELTYYVYPVYTIDAPSYEEVSADDILYYVNGSGLTSSSYEIFENCEQSVKDLIAKVAKIYAPKKDSSTNKLTVSEDNDLYKSGNLKELLDKYNELGGEKPSTEQKDANTEAKKAFNDAQKDEHKKVVDEIVKATVDGKNLGGEILAEYKENTEHSLKESYDSEIIGKVEEEILALIYECVTVDTDKLPEELVNEFVEKIYESHEYDYYTGKFGTDSTNLKEFDTFDLYLKSLYKDKDVNEEIVKKAKEEIVPIVKIFVVSQEIAPEAEAKLESYIKADYEQDMYTVDEELYREYYGENADKQIKLAKKSAEKAYKTDLKNAKNFVVDSKYMTSYKFSVGFAVYRTQVNTYGETNLRIALQTNNLLYYLTSANYSYNQAESHREVEYKDGKIDFRTISYTVTK